MPKTAYEYEAVIGANGKLEIQTSMQPGTPVRILLLTPKQDGFQDLVEASASSLDFWNNPHDEAWNHA